MQCKPVCTNEIHSNLQIQFFKKAGFWLGHREGSIWGGGGAEHSKIGRFRIFGKMEINSEIKNISGECKNDSIQVHCSMLQVQLLVD